MKTSLAVFLILISGHICFGQTTNFTGLFGIKLGEPLPASCTNSATVFEAPDENGLQTVHGIVPPQANSDLESNGYFVSLTLSNHLVCGISGGNAHDTNDEIFDGFRDALRNHYGSEDTSQSFAVSNSVTNSKKLVWVFNQREMELSHNCYADGVYMCFIVCFDRSLLVPRAHVVDTNGL